jgi:hypothetical protein
MRSRTLLFSLVLSFLSAVPSLAAQTRPHLVGEFGAWRVYKARQGKDPFCYVLASPTERRPSGLKRDPGFLFVSRGFHASDELSLEFGYRLNPKVRSTLDIGSEQYELMEQGEQAWLTRERRQSLAIAAMKRELVATVRTTSARGNDTQDVYSLKGFTKAYNAMRKSCRAGSRR